MAVTRKRRIPPENLQAEASARPPVRLIVRRGAVRRFDALKRKTSTLDVEVSWDRREAERRTASDNVPADRRKRERRGTPPFTWDLADFAVVIDSPSND